MKMSLSAKSILALILLLTACTARKSEIAVISGKIGHAFGEKLMLQELDTREIHNLDSTTLGADGQFSFQLAPREPGFYLLKAKEGKVLAILLDKGDTVTLGGDFTGFPDHIRFQGKPEAQILHDFFTFTRKNEKEVDSLELMLSDQQDSSGYYKLTLSLDTAFQKIWYKQKTFEEDFLTAHPNSLASLIVLNYSFGMSPVLSPEEDFRFYLELDSTLSKAYPGNKHVVYHHQRVLEYQRQKELKRIEK